MDSQSMDHPCGPNPRTLSRTRSMDYLCGPPLIFADEFYQRSKWILKNCCKFILSGLLCVVTFHTLPRLPLPWWPMETLLHRQTYSLLLTDQAQNDLHITVMSTKLARYLSNHISHCSKIGTEVVHGPGVIRYKLASWALQMRPKSAIYNLKSRPASSYCKSPAEHTV